MKRTFLSAAITTLIATIFLNSCSTTNYLQASKNSNAQLTPVRKVQQGELQGVYNEDGSVELYAGIPFAKPPVGDLRWKEPQDPDNWTGVFKADHYAARAMQAKGNWLYDFVANNFFYHNSGDASKNAPMSEDCLYLNIWKPTQSPTLDSGKKLPVLVYIHGGSLTSGSSYFGEYTGENLCQKDIIVVTVAYRLGIFGYFAHPELAKESPNGTTGNYGLLDQIKALEWVHNNIEAFGGDSNNITIAGESAGSSSVNAVCVSPLAKGLFNRAIGESSSITQPTPPHTFRSYNSAITTGKNIMAEFKCSSIEEMRNLPAEKLMSSKYTNSGMTVDGYALIETPWETYQKGNNNESALLNGFNANEGFVFTVLSNKNKKNYETLLNYYFGEYADEARELLPHSSSKEIKDAYTTMFSVFNFTYPHSVWTRTAKSKGMPVYEYYFTRENGGIGTYHSGEMIYAYHNVPKTKYYSQIDYDLEETMSTYWVNFIKTGNPNGQGLPYWPTAKEAPGKVLELGDTIQLVEPPYVEINNLLDKFQLPFAL